MKRVLVLKVPDSQVEVFDEKTELFIKIPCQTLKLEHSLLSISKWESKWKKPFLSKTDKKSPEETLDYIRCMTINNVDESVYNYLSSSTVSAIQDYINDPMTATTIGNLPNERPSRAIVTSELIYYWMFSFGIPLECEKWHLNRLLTLIKVCNIKSSKPKKMSRKEVIRQQSELNRARKKQIQEMRGM